MGECFRSISTDLPFSLADLCVEAQLGLEHQFQIPGDQLLRISVPFWGPDRPKHAVAHWCGHCLGMGEMWVGYETALTVQLTQT